MKDKLKPLLSLNLAALCISSSGFLGKLMTLPAPMTIYLRCWVALFFLYLFIRISRTPLKVDFKKHPAYFIISGLLMAGHWVTYFYALQVSDVATSMISLFCYPVITTLLEPIFFKTKLTGMNLIASLLVLLGLYFIVPISDLGSGTAQGVFWGILSAIFYALRNLMNKNYVKIYPSSVIMFYQLLIAAFGLMPVLMIYPIEPEWTDIGYLLMLGLVTTAIGHTLFVNGLKHFTTSTASIITGIQPVYGILLAVLFTGEKITLNIIIGGVLIILTVISEGLSQYWKPNTSPSK